MYTHLANCFLLAQLIATLIHYQCTVALMGLLVCFSRAGFADHVKLRLRQWDPWRVLDGRYGSDIHPCVGETSLKALQSCLGLRMKHFWTHSYSKQSYWKIYHIRGIIGESNIWRFTLRMQLARFLIGVFEYCVERNPCMQS